MELAKVDSNSYASSLGIADSRGKENDSLDSSFEKNITDLTSEKRRKMHLSLKQER
jgi:hypothetical protein